MHARRLPEIVFIRLTVCLMFSEPLKKEWRGARGWAGRRWVRGKEVGYRRWVLLPACGAEAAINVMFGNRPSVVVNNVNRAYAWIAR